ncbi:D-alanyl-D-alanine carboxypeptidase family protein [Streptomyces griseorubiginosus]|uniref:D-alanyl-D-alanine carboxypeptidase family protein n=1 Tax=Streptomyces griseorubiginosus TaxID=67304 RepID=UPI0036475672
MEQMPDMHLIFKSWRHGNDFEKSVRPPLWEGGRTVFRSREMSPPVKTIFRRLVLTVVLAPILALLPGSVGPAQAAEAAHALRGGQSLATGGRLQSPDGRYTLIMQTDGNLVLYPGSNPALWASGTAGHPGTVAQMQTDGNLVLYAPGHVPIWASSTAGHPGAYLELQNDGNAVIYRDPGHVAIWASRTSGGGTSATPITPLFNDSRNVPCASGTRDLGVADGYHNSARVLIRLCAVAGLRSTSEESGNTAHRVPGANGEAVVNSRVSGAVAAMFRSAKASGITLSASSAFRTMAHQRTLCSQNIPCQHGDYSRVAPPGKSNHQMGLAIDFAGIDSSPGCTNGSGPAWRWLRANAARFGFHQYRNEHWHWDVLSDSTRC